MVGDLLKQGEQLFDQYMQQASFGTSREGIGHQMRLLQFLVDRYRDLLCARMPNVFEDPCDLWLGSGQSLLRRWVRLQKEQGRALLQFAKEVQSDGIIRFETGGELVDQARLTVDQTLLVTRHGFEFLHDGSIGLPSPQIAKLGFAVFSQQIGINLICFGPRRTAVTIDGLGIDRIDGEACFQQRGDEQAMRGFDDAGHLLLALWSTDGEQKVFQLLESFNVMRNTARSHLLASVINHQHLMVV